MNALRPTGAGRWIGAGSGRLLASGACESAPCRFGLDAPGDDGALDGLARLGVAPEFAGPGTGKRQPVGAHMVLTEDIAGDIHGRDALAWEIIQTKLAGQGLIA